MEECCNQCVFFKRARFENECRRFPPAVHVDNETGGSMNIFPTPDRRDWCGEFKKRNEKDD